MQQNLSRRRFAQTCASFAALSACTAAPEKSDEAPIFIGVDPERDVFAQIGTTEIAELAGVPAPRVIAVPEGTESGTIQVLPDRLVLRFIFAPGKAMEYPVGLGRAGMEFEGEAIIERKAEWPSWTPTAEMIARDPDHYGQYADGVPGGPDNPLGARALYLYRNGVDTLYRIHGTDAPETIGKRASSGCIRMLNDHVEDLYARVPLGTRVVVVTSEKSS